MCMILATTAKRCYGDRNGKKHDLHWKVENIDINSRTGVYIRRKYTTYPIQYKEIGVLVLKIVLQCKCGNKVRLNKRSDDIERYGAKTKDELNEL